MVLLRFHVFVLCLGLKIYGAGLLCVVCFFVLCVGDAFETASKLFDLRTLVVLQFV